MNFTHEIEVLKHANLPASQVLKVAGLMFSALAVITGTAVHKRELNFTIVV